MKVSSHYVMTKVDLEDQHTKNETNVFLLRAMK